MNWGPFFISTIVSTVSDFKHCCRISNIHRKIKMQINIFTEITSGYVIRLTHILAACNSHKHHAIPTAVDLNCFAAAIHIKN